MRFEQIGSDVLFYQRLLKSDGLYSGKLDGLWGPKTEAATGAFYSEYENIKNKTGSFDPRTEKHIASLSIRAQREARLFMHRALGHGISVKIISGTRTYEEQDKLYRQGRYGNPGKVVTNARGGRSNHNFGIAWDIGIFRENGSYSTDSKDYNNLAVYAKSDALEWGGDWQSFVDPPHYQVKTTQPEIAWVRSRFESGKTYVA